MVWRRVSCNYVRVVTNRAVCEQFPDLDSLQLFHHHEQGLNHRQFRHLPLLLTVYKGQNPLSDLVPPTLEPLVSFSLKDILSLILIICRVKIVFEI